MKGDDDAFFPAMTERHENTAANADSHPIGDDIGKGLLQPLRRRIDDNVSKQKGTSVMYDV